VWGTAARPQASAGGDEQPDVRLADGLEGGDGGAEGDGAGLLPVRQLEADHQLRRGREKMTLTRRWERETEEIVTVRKIMIGEGNSEESVRNRTRA